MATINPTFQNANISLPKKVKVSYGSENYLLNSLRNIISIPTKIILWNNQVNSGNVSEKTIRRVTDYLEKRGLTDVQIHVNEYDPVKHFSRIFSNPKTSLLSKCTIGLFSSLTYTFLVDKLFGFRNDYYDFTSNDIKLFSEDSDLALLAGAVAANYNRQDAPTLHALYERLPLIGPFVHANHSEDQLKEATSYVRQNDTPEAHSRAWSVMAPANRIPLIISFLSTEPYRTVYLSMVLKCMLAELPPITSTLLPPIVAIILCHMSGRTRE